MKTIWIIDHYSSEPKYGGISRQYDFVTQLSQQGYKVIILSSGFSHYTHSYIGDSNKNNYFISKIMDKSYYAYLHTTSYDINAGVGRIKNMFSFMLAVQKQYKAIAAELGVPDVVEGASVHPLAWIAAHKIAKHYNVRYVVEVRDLWPEMWLLNNEKKPYDPMVLFFGTIEKWAYKKADKIIYSMIYGDKYICDKLGFPRSKVALIGQPLDCKRYDGYAISKFDLLPDDVKCFVKDSFLCVFTGYYMEYEGIYVMLEAAKMLKERGIPAKFLFLGSGKEADGMRKYAEENGLKNIMVGGRVSKEAIPALLRRANVCLAHCAAKGSSESFKYGISKNKVNEYLYSGACVIYGRADANDPVATSGAGYVIEPFSPEQFADKIEAVYKMNDEDRQVFGVNGKKYIHENHETSVLTRKLLDVLFE